MWAKDYRRFLAKLVQIGSIETEIEFTKGRNWRALLEFVVQQSPVARLPGWRRSVDRTRLHANSLLTGSFIGKTALLGLLGPISRQEVPVLQPLLEQFPS
jgi:hypothetical protein